MVATWTGVESRALREALRLSVREFGRRLGVSNRSVSKWEAGGSAIRPRPFTQGLLDTALILADDESRARVRALLHPRNDTEHAPPAVDSPRRRGGEVAPCRWPGGFWRGRPET